MSDEIEAVDPFAAAAKRRFIYDLTYPDGRETCITIGMPDVSDEGSEMEHQKSHQRLSAVVDTPIYSVVYDTARWATAVMSATGSAEDVPEGFTDLLVAYGRSLLVLALDMQFIAIVE